MGRFKKFIESETPKQNQKKKEKQGNVFKRKKRHKHVYKSKTNTQDFLNKMKEKGATIGSYSLMDAINSKNQKIQLDSNNIKKKSKNEKIKIQEFVDDSTEKEKEAMRNFVLSRYYDEEVEEEDDDDVFTQQTLDNKQKDDIISF